MAEAGDHTVENTQPRNSASLLEHGTEDNCVGGVGGTTANHLAETSDSRKRPGGSSSGKDLNLQAPAEKRARLDALEFQGMERGMPNQSTREEFHRNIRPPLHERSVEGGDRLAEPHLSQNLPVHPGWQLGAQWSQDDNGYGEEGNSSM